MEGSLLQSLGLGRPATPSKKAPQETGFFQSRDFASCLEAAPEIGRRECLKGKGTEGKHQASGPSWPCLSRVDFFFLTQRLKCFYLKRLFTFQSPKKKKKGSQAPGLYLSSAASQTQQHQSCSGGTFLALSRGCSSDSRLPPASRDCAPRLRRPGWRSGDRDWLGYMQG